ncbi:adenylate cyclase type 9-like [Sinocyclocheilus grahami]|uniref:adenylate cyclase n=1 Tax=Sinocyclocheilus grahami TaxID=75366 RepID=A0A672TDE4_SINGR|nr:PREDICTED: adenylate cyclase type 9-like [Sinocyclocheilus grahami]
MSLPEKHQPLHETEVRCDSEGGAVTVRITDSRNQQVGPGKEGDPVNMVSSKPCKYSISSSCSSGELGVPRAMMTRLSSPRRVPPLFERSAAQCWDPKFNSAILEEACRERCFPQMQRRFRYILFYLATTALLWGIYFGINSTRCDPTNFLVPTAGFLVLCLLLLWFTFSRPYARYYNHTSFLLTVIMFGITLAPQTHTAHFAHFDVQKTSNQSLLPTSQNAPCISPVGTFSLCIEVLLLLYSVLHLPLYVSVLLGLLYSVLYEALGWLHLAQMDDSYVGSDLHTLSWLGLGKVLLHLCAHIIGIHIFIMSEVRSRSTFLKVGQAIMHGKGLEVEKALKERMIHSVMPRLVADELMKQGDEESESSGKRYSAGTCSVAPASATTSSSPKSNKRKKNSIPRGQIIFRPFNMKRMEPVSILFADIVGFTKMSANKSAPALVGLLNDLFGRFDRLCELTRCEKISTLGDCYYCVAGCPEPHTDHAYCCVDMGLGMIQAIEQFCQETSETVDMRVGVHTGTVLCGILGMKRFKFDVWSNDVNLANLMEQLGVAGKVHLSEVTASFLDDRYEREDGQVMERVGHSVTDQLKGLKTYLISGWKMGSQCGCSQLSLGRDFSEMLSPSSNTHTPDLSHCTVAEPLSHGKPMCASCIISVDVVDDPVADEATRNGCQDEHRDNSSSKFPAGCSPKTLNGLLSPLCEERVRVSQSSLCDKLQEKNRSWVGSLAAEGGSASGMDHSAILPLRSKNFREKSDVHFVEVIKEDSLMKDYFFKPPINKLSLNFLEKSLESAYRTSYHAEVLNQVPVQTFASPVFSSLLDVLLSCAVFLALTFACFLYPLVTMETPLATTLCLAITAALVELVSLVLSIRMVFCLDDVQNCTRSLLKLVSGWLPRHVIGAVLVSLPAVSVFSHLAYSLQLPIQVTMFLCCALIIAIIQYCNFCQLSFWMRSTLATVAGLSLLILLYSATTRPSATDSFPASRNMSNQSAEVDQTGELDSGPTALDLLVLETVLSFFLLLMLVWFLNREFEVSYRLHYHGNVEADKHRIKIQTMRDQADWLLRNIIPIHVAEQLEVNQSYSKNHENVGVIFASIVNFSEFYEESYEGGKECYRVLNELIGDFDELLRKPAFSNVEKIKTIGATYMAASGLNGQQCQEQPHPHTHLRALFDFALEMMRVVDDFNKNMLGFKFKLRIGFNHGPLTAGVIGTTKLLYDIWGDTVNIASRMDSTGVECRIQVSEESHCVLNRMNYAFDYRGTVNVKGKGQMRTYLYPQMNEGRSGSTQSLEQGQVDGAVVHLEPTTLANATTRTSAAPLNPPSTSPNVASISGHGVPQGRGLGPSQITEELHQDSKDNSPLPELKEKDYQSPYQAPSLSGTQPQSIAQLYAPLARPETPLQGEEEDEADERTKLRAME